MATYLHFMLPPGLGRHFRIQALRTLVPPDQDDKALQYQGYAVRNSGTMLRKGDQVPGLARDQHTSPGMGKAIAVCSLIFGDSISYLVVSCSLPAFFNSLSSYQLEPFKYASPFHNYNLTLFRQSNSPTCLSSIPLPPPPAAIRPKNGRTSWLERSSAITTMKL